MRRIRNLGFLDHAKDEPEHLSIGKLVLYRNALSFNHTVYQVSNICSMWTEDHSRQIRHALPAWIVPIGAIGLIFLLGGIFADAIFSALLGAIALGAAVRAWLKFVPSTDVNQYALTIELTSGRKSAFMSSDQSFVSRAARIVAEAISSKSEVLQRVEMNFDNKTINIGRVEHSNIIGGDVTESHVEAS